MSDVLWESLVLTARTLWILGFFTLIGFSPAIRLFEKHESIRWIINAPILGLGITSLVIVPFSLRGIDASFVSRALLWVGIISCLIEITRLISSTKPSYLWQYFNGKGLSFLVIFVAPIAISTLMIFVKGQSSANDVWGSGDFGAYWIVAEYLEENGATEDCYESQDRFRSTDLEDHLTKHARLGCMGSLAALSSIFCPGKPYLLIQPFLLSSVILLLLTLYRWLEYDELNQWQMLLPFATFPFLYFLIYFTYLSQATGTLLCVYGLMQLNLRLNKTTAEGKFRDLLPSALCVGASLLHYPSMLIAITCFNLLALVICVLNKRGFSLIIGSVLISVFVTSYYIPQVVGELVLASKDTQIPGWNWNFLIGPYEFVGIESTFGYDLPLEKHRLLTIVEFLWAIPCIGLMIFGAYKTRFKCISMMMLVVTAVLATTALFKFAQGVPHASHAYVKVASTFALFIWLFMLLPIFENRLRPTLSQLGLSAICLFTALIHINTIYQSKDHLSWYTEDLIKLTDRTLLENSKIGFRPPLHHIIRNPLLKNEDRFTNVVNTGDVLVVWDPLLNNIGHQFELIDSEGEYRAFKVDR